MDLRPPIIELPQRPSLVYSPHPLLAGADRRIEYAMFMPGESIAAFLERVGVQMSWRPLALHLNDKPIPREAWASTYPVSGDLIVLRALVHGGGGGGGKSPIKTILSIALMVAAPGLGAAFGSAIGLTGTAFSVFGQAISWGSILGGVIGIAGSLLINALLPPPSPKLAQAQQRNFDQPSPTYSLAGGSNRARPYEPLPIVIGRHRIFPDYGAKTYTEFEGEDQYLYQVFNFGLSDVVLSDFKIGTTPLANFQGVTTEESGANGALTLFPANVDTTGGGDLTAAAGWIQRTSSINCTALSIDIAGQLYYTGDSGITQRDVTIEMEYRMVGAVPWLPFVGAVSALTLSSSSTKPLRKTYRVTVAQGQYEVRVRRQSADETDARAVSSMAWSQLRSYQPDLADYTGQKRVAVKIKASGQLQGQIEQLSAIASAKCPVWNGSAWVTGETSNPAWWFLWFARGKTLNGQRIYGGNLPDARIDIEGIKSFGAFCASKSLTVNAVFDGVQTVAEGLNTIARTGRGFLSWATGKSGVIWDASNLPVVQVFGMNNIRRRSFSVKYVTEKLADEVIVNFVNPDLDWQQDFVRAKVPGVVTPESFVTLDLFGCTDVGMAGREANMIAAEQLYHRRFITWESDFEGMTVRRGDVAALSHDLTQWGYSGRLVAGTSTVLTLDRKVPFTVGQQHYVRVMFPNGYFTVMDVVYQAGESDTITLTAALPTVDNLSNTLYTPNTDPNHPPWDYAYAFDPQATPGKKVKITGIQPLSESHVRITAVDEEPAYYAYESNPYTYTAPNTYSRLLPALADLAVNELLISASSGLTRCYITWRLDSAAGADISYTVNGGAATSLRVPGTVLELDLLTGDVISIEARPYAFGAPASSPQTLSHTVLGTAAPPPAPDTFTMQRLADGTRRYAWTLASVPPNVSVGGGYRIRYKSGTTSDWSAMTALQSGLLVSSPHENNDLAAGTWTLAIKTVNSTGVESTTAKFQTVTIGDPRLQNVLLQRIEEDLGWTGTKTGCFLFNGELIALSASTIAALPATIAALAATIDNIGTNVSPIVYESPVMDLGADVSFTPLVTVVAQGTATLTMKTGTQADGTVAGAYGALGQISGRRYVQIKVSVADTAPHIKQMAILIDSDVQADEYEDVNTATEASAWFVRVAAGHIKVGSKSGLIAAITQASITALQSVGAGWTWVLISKSQTVNSQPAAEFKIYNNGVLADAVIDVELKGPKS